MAEKLTPAQLHALAIVAKGASKVRKDLPVDAHPVDFTVHIAGTVNVSGDQTVSLSAAPTAVTVAAILLATLGPKKRVQLVKNIVDGNHLAGGIDDEMRDLAAKLIQGLTTSKTQSKKGSVSGKVEANLVTS